MRTVTIKNKARRMVAINLPHTILGPKFCRRVLVGALAWRNTPAAGGGLRKAVRGGAKRLSESVTLLAAGSDGDTVVGLPERVLLCPDVVALRRRGLIDVRELDEGETKAQAAELAKRAKAQAAKAEATAKHIKAKRAAKIAAAVARLGGEAPAKATPAPAPAEAPAPRKRSDRGDK